MLRWGRAAQPTSCESLTVLRMIMFGTPIQPMLKHSPRWKETREKSTAICTKSSRGHEASELGYSIVQLLGAECAYNTVNCPASLQYV